MTPTPSAPTAEMLAQRLRAACEKLRRTPMPIADMIPLLQQAADALARSEPPAQQRPAYCDLGRAADGSISQECCGNGACDYRDTREPPTEGKIQAVATPATPAGSRFCIASTATRKSCASGRLLGRGRIHRGKKEGTPDMHYLIRALKEKA